MVCYLLLSPSYLILSSFSIYLCFSYYSCSLFYWIFFWKCCNHFLWLLRTGKFPTWTILYFFWLCVRRIFLWEPVRSHHRASLFRRMVLILIRVLLFWDGWTFVRPRAEKYTLIVINSIFVNRWVLVSMSICSLINNFIRMASYYILNKSDITSLHQAHLSFS